MDSGLHPPRLSSGPTEKVTHPVYHSMHAHIRQTLARPTPSHNESKHSQIAHDFVAFEIGNIRSVLVVKAKLEVIEIDLVDECEVALRR